MAQDIRELFKNEKHDPKELASGHEDRFRAKLESELPKSRNASFGWMRIAASIVMAIGVGAVGFQLFKGEGEVIPTEVVNTNTTEENNQKTNAITLGSISPELKKVEDYYVTNINYELSRIDIDDDNKQLFDSYMKKLTELNDEYQRLTDELNRLGPNQQNVGALINNLQLRLQLLYQLQEKLEELKNTNNENTEQMA